MGCFHSLRSVDMTKRKMLSRHEKKVVGMIKRMRGRRDREKGAVGMIKRMRGWRDRKKSAVGMIKSGRREKKVVGRTKSVRST